MTSIFSIVPALYPHVTEACLLTKMASAKFLTSRSYTHIEHNIGGEGVSIDVPAPLYSSCTCEDVCNESCCCIRRSNAYNCNKLVQSYYSEHSAAVIECNSRCTCSASCGNRVVQNAEHPSIEVKPSGGKGLGVYAAEDIPMGVFVIEYVGEVIKMSSLTEKYSELDPDSPCYIIQYKEHLSMHKTVVTCIDASSYGNHSRFINHSCNPNLVMIPVRINSVVPHLSLFTSRNVVKSEELSYSYGTENVAVSGKPCLCGSYNCAGFLPFNC